MHWISRRALWSMVISVLVWLFLIGVIAVGAQAVTTPITLGENKTGSLADANSAALYSIEVGAPQSVIVLVLAVTPGFAPTFRVLDPGGVVVLDTANPGTQNIAQSAPNLSSSGTYTIEVRSANNSAGQFLISVQPGAPLTPGQALTPGTALNGSVDGQTTRQAYSFSGSASDVLLLTVRVDDREAGATIALRDADSDETLGLNSSALIGVNYRFPASARNYLLEVTHSGASGAQAFSVCLATESGSTTCPAGTAGTTVVEATAAPTLIAGVPSQTATFAPVAIDPNGSCQVTPLRFQPINVRSGPGTNFIVVGQILPNSTALVIDRLADSSWYQVNVGALGWVSAAVVHLGGNCSSIPVSAAPTAIPPTNATPVSAATHAPDNPPTEAPADAPPDTPKLDPHADPEYVVNLSGQGTIASIFYYIIPSAGGDVDASYLGGGCAGLVSAQPTLYINLTDPLPGLLRFYFLQSNTTDPVMIVQDPDGHFHCGDDSYGTVNPTIDLNGPSGGFPRTSPPSAGRYYIWIGSHSIPTSGTLHVTNSEDYHP